MTTIQITRHYSSFTNVADRFSVGNHEADGHAAMTEYNLPEGYEVQDAEIYDQTGYRCEIYPGDQGGPVLMGRYGQPETRLIEVQA